MKVAKLKLFVVLLALPGLHCFANQKVEWLDENRIPGPGDVEVTVMASVPMPEEEIQYLERTILENAQEVLAGDSGAYKINVSITEYEEGSAFARCMLIGLGTMHLTARIEVYEVGKDEPLKRGVLDKDYIVGGFVGFAATMRKDITSKVGPDIKEALRESMKTN